MHQRQQQLFPLIAEAEGVEAVEVPLPLLLNAPKIQIVRRENSVTMNKAIVWNALPISIVVMVFSVMERSFVGVIHASQGSSLVSKMKNVMKR
jgi:hypothetical protein